MSGLYFSADFHTARQRLRTGAAALHGDLHQLPLASTDGSGNPLGIDIAWFGSRQPRRALINVCGIHGIEGFAGSAVQLALLERFPSLPDDTALILVHVLNPYGMAQLRRGNENNVDLNRNFFFGTSGWQGESDGYTALDGFLNPPRPPTHFDFFHLRLLLAEFSLGSGTIRQTVAGGQYRFPKGIFYGGSCLEAGPKLYAEWLSTHLGSVRELFVIDVHTGLGSFGRQSLFLRSDIDAAALEQALGLTVATDSRETEVMGYEHEGGHSSIYRQLLPEAGAVCVTAEFGTYNGRRLLRALRAENQHHHYGDGRLDHWAKRKLKAMFCPEDERWRGQVVTAGIDLIRRSNYLPRVRSAG
jgi:hypothetical protein